MNHDLEQISPELWKHLESMEKDSEKIEKPSLTFLQDGWRRLKKNKTAMISMALVLILILGAIMIPFFWPYSYEEQTLTLSNVPPVLKIYPLTDEVNNLCIYITESYDAIEVTPDGELVQLLQPDYKDIISRKSMYNLNGKELTIDYSLYTQAKKEYSALEKKYGEMDLISTDAAAYLNNYFGDESKETTVSLAEAKKSWRKKSINVR